MGRGAGGSNVGTEKGDLKYEWCRPRRGGAELRRAGDSGRAAAARRLSKQQSEAVTEETAGSSADPRGAAKKPAATNSFEMKLPDVDQWERRA